MHWVRSFRAKAMGRKKDVYMVDKKYYFLIHQYYYDIIAVSKGPRTDPWGTPLGMLISRDSSFLWMSWNVHASFSLDRPSVTAWFNIILMWEMVLKKCGSKSRIAFLFFIYFRLMSTPSAICRDRLKLVRRWNERAGCLHSMVDWLCPIMYGWLSKYVLANGIF